MEGLPTKNFLFENCSNALIFMDDLNYGSQQHFDLAEIFKLFTHHNNCSVSFLIIFLKN